MQENKLKPITVISTEQKLSNEHWLYVKSVLKTHKIKSDIMNIIEFHYKTAFIHGYKHGVENEKNTESDQ